MRFHNFSLSGSPSPVPQVYSMLMFKELQPKAALKLYIVVIEPQQYVLVYLYIFFSHTGYNQIPN